MKIIKGKFLSPEDRKNQDIQKVFQGCSNIKAHVLHHIEQIKKVDDIDIDIQTGICIGLIWAYGKMHLLNADEQENLEDRTNFEYDERKK